MIALLLFNKIADQKNKDYTSKYRISRFDPAFSRIESIEKTDKPYENRYIPDEIEKWMYNSFGIFKNSEQTDVTIKFHKPILPLIRHKIFHPDQKTEEKDDALFITLPVSHYTEIIGRVLSYLPHAEIISPDDCRKEWQEKICKAYKEFCR